MDIRDIKNYLARKQKGLIRVKDGQDGNKIIQIKARDDDDQVIWIDVETNSHHLNSLIVNADWAAERADQDRSNALALKRELSMIELDLYGKHNTKNKQ